MFEMAAPSCWVLSFAIDTRLRPIEDTLDASAKAAGRLGSRSPDRFEDLEHEPGIDRSHRQLADDRIRIGLERRLPLAGVLCTAPASTMRLDVGIGALLERHRFSRVEPSLRARGVTTINRIDALMTKLAGLPCLLARLRQTVDYERPETHLAHTAIERKLVNPRSAALRDLQIEPAAIAVHAGRLRPARLNPLFDVLHLARREPSHRPRHVLRLLQSKIDLPPRIPISMKRTVAKDCELSR